MKQAIRLALLLLLVGGSLSQRSLGEAPITASVIPEAVPAAALDTKEDELYAKGTKAMDEQRWADAVTAFDGVVAAKGKRADAAMYWKAYNLDKLGRKDESRAACSSLRQQQPSSTWNRECAMLRVRTAVDVQGIAQLAKVRALNEADLAGLADMDLQSFGDGDFRGVHVYRGKDHVTTDEDIKILALNSLMRQDPAKALPLLRDLIHSDKPIEVRKQALFVLSRSKQPEAQTMLNEVATNKSDLVIQREAVQMLAINRGKDAGPTLVDIYRGSTDAGVKRAAVNGLFIAHDAPRLVDLARGEKDLNLKRDIVSQLALMKDPAATDYMLELLK